MSDRPRRKHTAVLAELIDPARQRLVDVGCGQGALTRRLAKAGGDVVGVDPHLQAVEAAQRHDTAAHFLAGCGEALPLADHSRDLLLYFNALHHVPVAAMDRAIAEAHRVLVEGGRLVAVEPLAEGAVFELMRPVEDETEIRAAAEEALQRAAASDRWRRLDRRDYLAPVRYDSFDAFRDGLLAVDPARAEAVRAHEAAMRQGFEAAVQHESDAYWLDRRDYLAPVRYDSFDAFRDGLLAVDPARAEAVRAHEAAMRQGFNAAARRENDAYWLDQPCRLTVLQAMPSAD